LTAILQSRTVFWSAFFYAQKNPFLCRNKNLKFMEASELIFGVFPLIEAIKAGKEIDTVMVQRDLRSASVAELISLCTQHQIPVTKVPTEKLNRLTSKNHQGVAGFLSAVSFASLDHIISETFAKGKNPLILILDRVTDVRNFGGIVRTAECAGVNAIIVPDRGKARIGGDAFKTSAGALGYMPICREKNLKDTIKYLKNCGLQIVACTEKADTLLYDAPLDVPTAVIMGSEEDGILPEYLRTADILVQIPMFGRIGSLNVSVAGSIVLYEAVRQRQIKKTVPHFEFN
jgi:23S rRNA (guanosine2251-2'-O)-methyltransferase